MGQRRLGRGHHHGLFNVGLAVGDVVAHSIVEQDGVLGNNAHLAAQREHGHVAHVVPINHQAAASYVEESRNEIGQRGFTGAARADKGHDLAPADLQVDAAQHLAGLSVLAVGKAHIAKADAGVKPRKNSGVGPLLHLVVYVHEVEDGRRSAQGLLKAVVEEGKLAHRIVELEHPDNKSHEGANREVVGFNLIAPQQQQKRYGDGAEDIHQGRAYGCRRYRSQVGAEEALRRLGKPHALPQFHAESFHNAVAGDGLMQDVLDLGQLILSLAGRTSNSLSDASGRGHDKGYKQQKNPGRPASQAYDHACSGDQDGSLLQKFRQHRRHGKLHLLHVVHGGHRGAS